MTPELNITALEIKYPNDAIEEDNYLVMTQFILKAKIWYILGRRDKSLFTDS